MSKRSRTYAYGAMVALGAMIVLVGGDWWFVGVAIAASAVVAWLTSFDTLPGGFG